MEKPDIELELTWNEQGLLSRLAYGAHSRKDGDDKAAIDVIELIRIIMGKDSDTERRLGELLDELERRASQGEVKKLQDE